MADQERNVTSNGDANGSASSVARIDFRKNPAQYVDQARAAGPVTITDEAGAPRIMIVVPKRVVDYDDA